MPNYFTPGVYVEEVDRGARPIQGVSTSVAGAVGVTVRGPTNGKPVLVTSFSDCTRIFGGFFPEPAAGTVATWRDRDEGGYWWLFTHAVKGFFDNGGKQLFVKRVFSKRGALASSVTLQTGLYAEITENAAATADQMKVRHTFGLAPGTIVEVVNG